MLHFFSSFTHVEHVLFISALLFTYVVSQTHVLLLLFISTSTCGLLALFLTCLICWNIEHTAVGRYFWIVTYVEICTFITYIYFS